MTISELIHKDQNRTDFSFEVLPPLKGNGTTALFRTIDRLKEFAPKYINITTHRSEYVFTERPDGTFNRQRIRRRPGTVAVASAIMQKYDIRVVPHVVCSGATQEDIEYMLLDLQFLGLTDILLLRGDKAPDEKTFTPVTGGYRHTTELIEQVNRFNEGFFYDGSPIRRPGIPFSYGVACYPEKHEEAPNLEFDLKMLKRKQDMGANYAITQLFYDNKKYFAFVERARSLGITMPIIPAIKPLAKLSQFTVVPKTFHVDLPDNLTREAEKCTTDEQMQQLGVEWAVAQCRELIAAGVPCIHFYTVSAVDSICQIASQIY